MASNDPLYNTVNPTLNDVFRLGKELMNRSARPLGGTVKGGTEDRRFCSFFGISAHSVHDTWSRLEIEGLIPPGGIFLHLLWALLFMKTYSVEAELCAHAGGRYGAVDPKTFRKWMWPMVHALEGLEYTVVSKLYPTTASIFFIPQHSTSVCLFCLL
jgi:hypothetical protein